MICSLNSDTILDMMPDDIPHTDDKAKRKIHPRAMDCFIISLVPVALYASGYVVVFVNGFIEHQSDFYMACQNVLLVWTSASLAVQPLGIVLGIYSLGQIRENSSCSGAGYAIAGIITTTLVFLALLFAIILDSS